MKANGTSLSVTPRVRYKTHFHKSQYEIFSVRTDKNGYPQFLIYDKGQWLWKSAKYFEPVN